jgi:preprotein translocase YajC subunit
LNLCYTQIIILSIKEGVLNMTDQGIILIAILVALLIIYPFLMSFRNKREQQKQITMANSLKKGDFIITYSGVYGKITEISEKEMGKFITIETGESHKNYVTVSANAVYMVTSNKPATVDEKGSIVDEKVEAEKSAVKVEENKTTSKVGTKNVSSKPKTNTTKNKTSKK